MEGVWRGLLGVPRRCPFFGLHCNLNAIRTVFRWPTVMGRACNNTKVSSSSSSSSSSIVLRVRCVVRLLPLRSGRIPCRSSPAEWCGPSNKQHVYYPCNVPKGIKPCLLVNCLVFDNRAMYVRVATNPIKRPTQSLQQDSKQQRGCTIYDGYPTPQRSRRTEGGRVL